MSKDHMATLDDAILLAAQSHRGQKDKAGGPYILHPLRLMLKMSTEEEMMTAVLHDVIEDSEHTLSDLRQAGYPEPVLAALDCLTRRETESYEEFIERIRPNPLARRVKLADLEDNMNLQRIPHPQPRDLERVEKYRRARARLEAE
jgi:(p)ppGpp synthase/HD superfamily hydrolase